jgi:hypothetical protein
MNARPNLAGLSATGDRAIAEAAAIHATLSKLGPQGGSRLQDFDDRTQRAITARDIEEAVGIEFERLEDKLSSGSGPLTDAEKIEFDLLERIFVTACQSVEGRRV